MNEKRLQTAALTACAIVLTSAASRAGTSSWASKVGKILSNDQTVSCNLNAALVPNGQGQNVIQVTATLTTLDTDGRVATPSGDGATNVAVQIQCLDTSNHFFGPFRQPAVGFASTPPSVRCGVGQLPLFAKCVLDSTDTNPFTYGNVDGYGGDPCADGVSGVSVPSGNGYLGQVTGQKKVLNFSTGKPLYNFSPSKPTMGSARIWGTDMGFAFYSRGVLWSGYGDTWENASMTSISPTKLRGSVLFSTHDLNPSDGLTFEDWIGKGNNNGFAAEAIHTCHNDKTPPMPPCQEGSAIPGAGFGLTEGDDYYKILWYALFTPSFEWMGSSVAWAKGAGAFVRGDQNKAPKGTTPPRWTRLDVNGDPITHFGAGGIWQDRFGGYIYFFGTRVYDPHTSVRLARVPAKFDSVVDGAAYQYWNGLDWQSSQYGITDTADLIKADVDAGAELSVVFNPYVNRFLMMIVRNRNTSFQNPTSVELWQAVRPVGPWTPVATGNRLPNPGMNKGPNGQQIGLYPGDYWYFYGPYMSEQLMTNNGRSIYYQLSEWNGTPGSLGIPYAGLPYNVGLWTYNVDHANTAGCAP